MRKIPTIFQRDWENDPSRVLDIPHPDCAWVFAGEGVPTRKYDGMCVMYDGAQWFKRREVRDKDLMTGRMPEGFISVEVDPTTLKVVGWVPISASDPVDKYMRDAIVDFSQNNTRFWTGTAEFLGPKSQGNVEHFPRHIMLPHAWAPNLDEFMDPPIPRTFEGLKDFLTPLYMEGIVFQHPDGRYAKIKKRDFGLKRQVAAVLK